MDLQKLIRRLLEKDPAKRLGTQGDAEEVKAHPWFKTINWAEMLQKDVEPPFIPYVSSKNDTRNFFKEYTETKVIVETPETDNISSEVLENEKAWKDFTYTDN